MFSRDWNAECTSTVLDLLTRQIEKELKLQLSNSGFDSISTFPDCGTGPSHRPFANEPTGNRDLKLFKPFSSSFLLRIKDKHNHPLQDSDRHGIAASCGACIGPWIKKLPENPHAELAVFPEIDCEFL